MEFHGSGSRDPMGSGSNLGSGSGSVALVKLSRISFFLVENCTHLAQLESTPEHLQKLFWVTKKNRIEQKRTWSYQHFISTTVI
jgi:hypothetical protein